MKRIPFYLFISLISLCFRNNADALSTKPRLKELVKSSDSIAVGTVQKMESRPTKYQSLAFSYGGNGSMVTCVEFSVEKYIKNPSLESKIAIVTREGKLANLNGMDREDDAVFQIGEKCLVFLSKEAAYVSGEFCSTDGYRVNFGAQGKYTIADGTIANIMSFAFVTHELPLEQAIALINDYLK